MKKGEKEREKKGSWEDKEDENEEETGVERDILLLLVNGLLEEGSLDLGGNRGRLEVMKANETDMKYRGVEGRWEVSPR